MPPRRGRPPVRCTDDNPCTKADQQVGTVAEPKTVLVKPPTRFKDACPECGGKGGHTAKCSHSGRVAAPENDSEPRTGVNPSLAPAMEAKAQLMPLGWHVVGKAKGTSAQLTAQRGSETLIMVWRDGEIVTQDYSLFYVKPSENEIPPHSLSFEPDELTNSELVQILRGMKVTWWNTLAHSTETAVVGNKVSIEHIYDDDREKRIVKFIAHDGGGFRAFNVPALLKVG